jgi:hypothetical protein
MSRQARATDSIVLTSIAIYPRVKSVRYAPHLRSERFSRFLDCLKRQAESLSKSAYISPFLSIASGRDARRLKYFHFEHRGFDLPSRTISHHLPIEETKLRGSASTTVEVLRCNHTILGGGPCDLQRQDLVLER